METVKFALGRVVMTRGVLEAIADRYEPLVGSLLSRHSIGDWGDVSEDDKRANAAAIEEGTRLLSAYQVSPTLRIWILTEADRSATTILLPEEY